ADDQLQQLEPDDLVDEGRATTAHKKQQHRGQVRSGSVNGGRSLIHKSGKSYNRLRGYEATRLRGCEAARPRGYEATTRQVAIRCITTPRRRVLTPVHVPGPSTLPARRRPGALSAPRGAAR